MPFSVGNFLWKYVFTAFLPPLDPDDVDYYTVLALESKPSTDDIRKAYRKLSLELHPDKIAQRGGGPDEKEAARVKYEAVQQAYGVLVDPKTRAQYDEWRPSPSRYQFVTNSQWYHPAPLMENLAKASFLDKSKLLLLVTVFLLGLLVQPILICTKVNDDGRLDDAPWLLLLIPLWCFGALVLLFWITLAVVTRAAVVAFLVMEYAAWLCGCIVLACIWDGVIESINWYVAAIPFYLGLLFRMMQVFLSIRTARDEQEKMISPDHLQQLLREYRDMLRRRETSIDEEKGEPKLEGSDEDLLKEFPTEEAYIEYLEHEYTVVTVNDEAVAAVIAIMESPDASGVVTLVSDEEKEVLQVTMSHEYVAMETDVIDQKKSLFVLISIGITFVTLVAHKLQSSSDASWWAIFAPFWIYFGASLFNSCFMCLCTNVSGDPIILSRPGDFQAREDGSDKFKAEGGDEDQPTSSVVFAAPEGQIDDINDKCKTSHEAKHVDVENVPLSAMDANISTVADCQDNVAESPAQATTDNDASVRSDGPVTPNAGVNGNGDDKTYISVDETRADSKANEPDIDFEAAFHAYQNAHAQAEQSAMEQQMKATSACCNTILQLIIVTLIVGKLQAVTEGGDDESYSAFWVLFPVFFLSGIVLCCCSFFIFSAGADSINIVTERQDDANDQESADDGANTPSNQPNVIPSAQVAGATHQAAARDTTQEQANSSSDVETPAPSNDSPDKAAIPRYESTSMDDLD